MIDNEHGTKNRVLIQWMSRDYLVAHKKDMTSVTVGPDEYLILLKNGKVEAVSSQDRVDVPKLKTKFWEFYKESGDVQIAVMDTRKHELTVPFEAYTKDRELIRGTVNLMANIRADDCVRALRLIKESGADGYLNNSHGYREFTLDDVSAFLRKNIEYVIDTESISAYTSSDVFDNRSQICATTVAALNTKTPYWANYGLMVYYSSITLDENEYERIERQRHAQDIDAMQRDLDYAKASGDSEQTVRLAELINSQKAAVDLDEYLSRLNVSASKKAKEMELEYGRRSAEIGYQSDLLVQQAEAKSKLQRIEALQKQEMKNILDNAELDDAAKKLKLAEAELQLHRIQKDIKDLDREQNKSDADLEMYISERKAKFASDLKLEEIKAKSAILMEMKEQDLEHDKFKIIKDNEKTKDTLDADVKIAAIQNDAKLARSQERSENLEDMLKMERENKDLEHKRQLETMGMMVNVVGATNGGATNNSPKVSVNCPKCGSRISGGEKFCGNCGAKLEWSD